MNSRSIQNLLLLAAPCFLGSCGSGTWAILGLGDDGGGGGNAPAVVGDLVVGSDAADARTSPVTIAFALTDAESDPADVDVLFLPPGGGDPVAAALVGDSSLDELATSPAGTVHTRQWEFASQVPTANAFAPGYRILVRTRAGSSIALSNVFDVGNDVPVVSGVTVPSGETSGIVPIALTAADSSSDLLSIAVEYDDLDDAEGWKPATPAGAPLAGVGSTPEGVPLQFLWDAPADQPAVQFTARLRFTPSDGTATGAAVETTPFVLDNNAEPVVLLNGSAFAGNPDQRRGIPIPLRIVDPEGDPVRVVLQWRTPFGSFPELPENPADLEPILASPALRRQHQIATEAPVAFRGGAVPAGAAAARLPDLAASEAGIVPGVLPGRTLEVLRTSSVPVPMVAGWSANPLHAPAALLALVDGPTALVLDAPAADSWRLREIDLATGAVAREVASSAGSPDALAFEPGGASALVASDVGGVWRIERVALADGAVTEWITASGSTALGPIRGLASPSPGLALATVGNVLVAIDATSAGAATETAVGAPFQTAHGIALDPRDATRLYLAERDWVNPATATAEGRVLSIDLVSGAREPVAATGTPLLRPESLAVDPRGGLLLALTDANPADGTRELRAVPLNGGGGGAAYQVASGFPDGCRGLAAGPEGLRMLALPAADDVAVAGGVEQVRTIAAYDDATGTATASLAFAPLLDARRRWRVVDALAPRPASTDGIDDVFVWDSSDLAEGGEVVVRAVPYDSERGLASDSGVPRTIRAGIDVTPYTIGSAASTSNPSTIAVADLNGDGRPDLVTGNVGSDDLSVFFQDPGGSYPAAPSSTLTGVPFLAPTTNPSAVRAVDVDSDGDLDVVVAGRGSHNVVVFTQTAPGAYLASPSALTGVNAPSDVAVADVNGDGRMDLVTASTGSDRIAIHLQLPGGLFLPAPSLTIGNAGTDAPSSIALGDLDGDGDVDIVSANRNADDLTIFLQSAPGAFPATPSLVLGGAGLTDGPVSVVVGDLDGDGRLDVASANRDGDDLAVFLQSAAGTFSGTPSALLAASGAPLQPSHLDAVDVNGDGVLDLVSTNGGDDVSIFVGRRGAAFAARPIVLATGIASPSWVAAEDLNGDGLVDLAVTNAATNDVSIFVQRGPSGYASLVPDLVLGNANATSNPSGLAAGDLDGDGDLDLVCANEDAGNLTVFEQFSPSIFGSEPATTLGSPAATPGAHAVVAADLNGDGRLDIASANRTGGSVTIFFQPPSGPFPGSVDLTLGNGALGSPSSIAAADLDGDGDLDLVSANATASDLTVFRQLSPGSFAAAPSLTLGGNATTKAPGHVLAIDLDRDGDVDLACANATGNDVAVFLNPGDGAFPSAPSFVLGSPGTTPSPRGLTAGDLDGDGDVDLVCANGGNSSLAVFLQGAPGVFPVLPSFTRTHASLVTPDTLAAADVDGDGDLDLVSGNTGTHNLTIFRQGNPGVFATTPEAVGGPGSTDSPRALAVVDVDGDGDLDLLTAEPVLDDVAIFFGSH